MSIGRSVHEFDQLDEHALYVTELFHVAVKAVLHAHEPLVLVLELILKVDGDLILHVFEAFDEIAEALIQILDLLTEQLVQFFSRLLE